MGRNKLCIFFVIEEKSQKLTNTTLRTWIEMRLWFFKD